jgi:hypothetical protein
VSGNPLNLAFRFFLELAGLVALGWGGWALVPGVWGWVLAFAIPIAAAAMWGTFRFPNDPKTPPVTVHGLVRLALEAAYFGGAVALAWRPAPRFALALAVATALHYALSWDRVARLARNDVTR